MRLTPDEPHGPMFDNTNRGKKSVILDVKKPADMVQLPRAVDPVHSALPLWFLLLACLTRAATP